MNKHRSTDATSRTALDERASVNFETAFGVALSHSLSSAHLLLSVRVVDATFLISDTFTRFVVVVQNSRDCVLADLHCFCDATKRAFALVEESENA